VYVQWSCSRFGVVKDFTRENVFLFAPVVLLKQDHDLFTNRMISPIQARWVDVLLGMHNVTLFLAFLVMFVGICSVGVAAWRVEGLFDVFCDSAGDTTVVQSIFGCTSSTCPRRTSF
jgi:hypothetical protein